MSAFCLLSLCVEASAVTKSPFLLPESELLTEPEEEEEDKEEETDTKEAEEEEEEQGGVDCPSLADSKMSNNWSRVFKEKIHEMFSFTS